MDPDVLITISFVSLVVLVALAAGLFARAEYRRTKDADESTAEPLVGPLPAGLEWSAAETLVASHAEYPSFRHVFPNPRRRRRALRSFFYATVRDAMRFGVVRAVREGSRVLAVAVWLGPDTFPWSLSRKLRAMPYLLRVLAADPRRFRTFMSYGANVEGAHPPDRHWYLVVAGVRPEAQRRGFGSRLIRHGIQTADGEGVPLYLETADPANVDFYEQFGFTVTDDALELVPDGPSHVAMRRTPAGDAIWNACPPRIAERVGAGLQGVRSAGPRRSPR